MCLGRGTFSSWFPVWHQGHLQHSWNVTVIYSYIWLAIPGRRSRANFGPTSDVKIVVQHAAAPLSTLKNHAVPIRTNRASVQLGNTLLLSVLLFIHYIWMLRSKEGHSDEIDSGLLNNSINVRGNATILVPLNSVHQYSGLLWHRWAL